MLQCFRGNYCLHVIVFPDKPFIPVSSLYLFFDEKSSTWSFYENVYHSSSDDGNGMDGLYITSYTLFSFLLSLWMIYVCESVFMFLTVLQFESIVWYRYLCTVLGKIWWNEMLHKKRVKEGERKGWEKVEIENGGR